MTTDELIKLLQLNKEDEVYIMIGSVIREVTRVTVKFYDDSKGNSGNCLVIEG